MLSDFFNYSNSSKKKLKDVCCTSCVERITGIDDLEELFIPIIFCLEQMNLNVSRIFNEDTSTKALSYYNFLTSFDFILR